MGHPPSRLEYLKRIGKCRELELFIVPQCQVSKPDSYHGSIVKLADRLSKAHGSASVQYDVHCKVSFLFMDLKVKVVSPGKYFPVNHPYVVARGIDPVVLRGDVHSIRIGDYTNVQDGTVIHVTHGGCN